MKSLRAAAGVSALILLIAACSSSSEEGLEQLIESQTDGDVDINLEDGEIRVQTSDGEFSIDVDEEDGGFSVEVDGEEVLSGEVDDEGGSIQIDEDGDTVIEVGGEEIPEDWPDEIPPPDEMTVESSSSFDANGQLTVTVTGSVSDGEQFVEDYIVALNAAGLPQTTSLQQDDSVTSFHENESWFVSVIAAPLDGTWQVSVSVLSAS